MKDHIKMIGEPHNVQITKGLLQASREAHKAYSKRLSDEREELAKKKKLKEAANEQKKKTTTEILSDSYISG